MVVPPPKSDAQSALVFSLAKAGSTLLFNLMLRIAPKAGLTYFSIEDYLFSQNVSSTRRPLDVGSTFHPKGYCYGGFRQFPAYPVPILHSSKVILLVRDPRDMITSLYFSVAYSHEIPEEGGPDNGAGAQLSSARQMAHEIGIDTYAKQATRDYIRMFEGYVAQGFLWRPNVVIYRYEDIIYRKREWVDDMCEWFGWDVPTADREAAVDEFDELPSQERPNEHVRQVSPGNHKRHISEEAEQEIRARLSEYMELFGYT
ncbi:sulfotransferase domain-containing protein [Roseomonas sp. CCTCC AB2023176]|uniref:sulfotransferase domain-containing protein n=1 Tax=Roseomonas sp. CCTCC AB2023176 TaxID=3342640 RepID=UPI0035E048F2